MKHSDFDKFLEEEVIAKIRSVLSSKSADYSKGDDKLYNFKLAAEMDGDTSLQALRGMHLKHRASIRQGLDEVMMGEKLRDYKWWLEKVIDDVNYDILMLAMLYSGEF